MADLNPCRFCGAPAVEHIRGEFHKNTRDDRPENHVLGKPLTQMEPDMEDDYRISCSRVRECDFVPLAVGAHRSPGQIVDCDNFLPWARGRLKDVSKQRELWNKLNPREQYGNS